MSPISLRRRKRSPAADAYTRARRPDLHTPWRQARLAAVDLEMTGLDPRRDEIISFASVPIEEGRIVVGEARAALVRPERMPAEDTIRIHGLRPADLEAAPALGDALDGILDALAGRVIIAHPARVERSFLAPALKRAGAQLHEPILCTARLAARVLAGPGQTAVDEVPLAAAAERLRLPVHSPHNAMGDALTTAQLFLALATRLDRSAPQTVGSLARASETGKGPLRDTRLRTRGGRR